MKEKYTRSLYGGSYQRGFREMSGCVAANLKSIADWRTQWEQIPASTDSPSAEEVQKMQLIIQEAAGIFITLSRSTQYTETQIDGCVRANLKGRIYIGLPPIDARFTTAQSTNPEIVAFRDVCTKSIFDHILTRHQKEIGTLAAYHQQLANQHPNLMAKIIDVNYPAWKYDIIEDRLEIFRETCKILPDQEEVAQWSSHESPSFRKWFDQYTKAPYWTLTNDICQFSGIPGSIGSIIDQQLKFVDIHPCIREAAGIEVPTLPVLIHNTALVLLFGDRIAEKTPR